MNPNIFSYYCQEIEQHWKYKEVQRDKFKFTSPQLGFRKYLIEWLQKVSERLKVSYRTIHLAIHILDIFMDNHSITKDRLGFVALVCLMLAAKFEETDSKVPKISDLNSFDGFRYSNKDFIRVEAMVLKCLNFDLTQPTVTHFAEYYAMVTLLPQNQNMSQISLNKFEDVASQLIGEFLDLCLKEVKFLRKRPSLVAAACMFAARYCLNLSPTWTHVLANVTGYEEEDIISCAQMLLLLYQEKAEKNSISVTLFDSGYASETSSN